MAKAIKWSFAALQHTFGLKQRFIENYPLLESWINSPIDLTKEEQIELETIRKELQDNVLYWNEEELKMYFISVILRILPHKDIDGIRGYLDREISSQVQNTLLKAKADYMIAKGFGDIMEAPYFCFHEYKQEKSPSEDPAAQVLKAMLIAREVNHNNHPIYGCYVTGRNWYFLILENNDFAISNPLAATDKKELFQIVSILKAFKTILVEKLMI